MAHQPKPPRLPTAIRVALAGADWRWVNGTRHWKLVVNGKMVAIWPKGLKGRIVGGDRRAILNARSHIRAALRRKVA